MIRIFASLLSHAKSKITKSWFIAVFFLLSLLAYSTAGFLYFELPARPDLKWIDAFWWAIVTMTTVGYGDYAPASFYGRVLVGFPTMLMGVGVLGYLLSTGTSKIVESRIREMRGMKKIMFEDHIIICNYNNIGQVNKLINELRKDDNTKECPIVIIDDNLDQIPEELVPRNVFFVRGNPSRDTILERANFRKAKAIIIDSILTDPDNSDMRNLATVLTIERIAENCFTVVHCLNPENEVFFRRAGCDSVVSISTLSSQLLVQEVQDPGVHSVIQDLTSNEYGSQIYIVKSPAAINFGNVCEKVQAKGFSVMGIRRGEQNLIAPDSHMQMEENDFIIVIGRTRPDF